MAAICLQDNFLATIASDWRYERALQVRSQFMPCLWELVLTPTHVCCWLAVARSRSSQLSLCAQGHRPHDTKQHACALCLGRSLITYWYAAQGIRLLAQHHLGHLVQALIAWRQNVNEDIKKNFSSNNVVNVQGVCKRVSAAARSGCARSGCSSGNRGSRWSGGSSSANHGVITWWRGSRCCCLNLKRRREDSSSLAVNWSVPAPEGGQTLYAKPSN